MSDETKPIMGSITYSPDYKSEKLSAKVWLAEDCGACGGYGRVKQELADGVEISTTCLACNGTGRRVRHQHSPESSLMAPDEEDRLQERVKELEANSARLEREVWERDVLLAAEEKRRLDAQGTLDLMCDLLRSPTKPGCCAHCDARFPSFAEAIVHAKTCAKNSTAEENSRLKAELKLLRHQTPADWQRFKDERDALKAELAQTKEALEFYADPETYHGVAFLFDPPGGGFASDFGEDHGHSDYDRPMPGVRARGATRGKP